MGGKVRRRWHQSEMILCVAFSEEVPQAAAYCPGRCGCSGALHPHPQDLSHVTAQHPQLFLAVGLEACLEELPGTSRGYPWGPVPFCYGSFVTPWISYLIYKR